jgi:hypothetical protein
MNAIITVFKTELAEKKYLIPILSAMAREVTEFEDAYIYRPQPGRLMSFLAVLKEKDVAYGTHFEPSGISHQGTYNESQSTKQDES